MSVKILSYCWFIYATIHLTLLFQITMSMDQNVSNNTVNSPTTDIHSDSLTFQETLSHTRLPLKSPKSPKTHLNRSQIQSTMPSIDPNTTYHRPTIIHPPEIVIPLLNLSKLPRENIDYDIVYDDPFLNSDNSDFENPKKSKKSEKNELKNKLKFLIPIITIVAIIVIVLRLFAY